MALGMTLGILILQDMYGYVADLIKYGASVGVILRYYLILIPSFLPAIIPLALLISLIFSLGNLHKNNEIIAMRAAGMHLLKITRSLFIAGAFLAGILFYLNAQLVPYSVERSRSLLANLRFATEIKHKDIKDVGLIPAFAFDNLKEGRLWFMDGFSEYTYQGFGVNVYQRNAEGKETHRLVAREAFFDDAEGYWVFLEGAEWTYDPETGEPLRHIPFAEKPMPNFTEPPTIMEALSQRPVDLSLWELKGLLDKVSPEENPALYSYEVRYHSILASPFGCILVVALAIPFVVSGVRVNPAVGVAKAAGLFFAYYLLVNIGTLLAAQQVISSIVAAWVPNVMMLIVAIGLFRRMP